MSWSKDQGHSKEGKQRTQLLLGRLTVTELKDSNKQETAKNVVAELFRLKAANLVGVTWGYNFL